jgi:hypothetical protein
MIFGVLAWVLAWTVLRHLPPTGVPGIDGTTRMGSESSGQWLCFAYIGAVLLLLDARRSGSPGWRRSAEPDAWRSPTTCAGALLDF